MICHDHLFARDGIAPFLMASRAVSKLESAAAQDRDDLLRGKPGRAPFTPEPHMSSIRDAAIVIR